MNALHRTQLLTRALYGASFFFGAASLHAQVPTCAGQPSCAEVTTFVAVVADFRPSTQGATRLVTTTVRFQNKTPRPLVLGYVVGSGIVTDDQGNRYAVTPGSGVRGIGEISSSTFDPKFVLQPGEKSDGRFEFAFRPDSRSTIFGTKYEVELTVRELTPVAGNQFRLGREHALRFTGFGAGAVVAADAAAPAGNPSTSNSAAAPAPAQVPPMADPCAGAPRCYATGPFKAEVASVSTSEIGGRHLGLQVSVRVRNLTTQPIVLGYREGSSGAIDDLGNRYYFGRPGTHDVSTSGIGHINGLSADPQFSLAPGEARMATFNLIRYDAIRQPRGTVFTHNLTLEQLEILPSRQVRSVREYAVQLTGLSPNVSDAVKGASNAAGNAAAKKLLDDLKKKIKKN